MATVFQAEVHAINNACNFMLQASKYSMFQKISIYSDSFSGLQALSNDDTSSAMIKECKETLNKLNKKYAINVYWIKGHNNETGNELADMIAKLGTTPHPVVEPVLPLSKTYFHAKIEEFTNKKWQENWDKNPEQFAVTKKFISVINTDKSYRKSVLSLKRPQLHKLVSWVTGHTPLRNMLNKYYPHMSKTCRKCNKHDETSYHVLMECESTLTKRYQHIGNYLHDQHSRVVKNYKSRKKFWTPKNKRPNTEFVDLMIELISDIAPSFET
jgi:hypothetical protein